MNRRRGRGEGSIKQRADGRWEARLDFGCVDGKRKQKSLYGRTRKEAADNLRKAQQQLEEGTLLLDERMTVGDWLAHWIDVVLTNRVENGVLSESTYYSYADTVRLHLKPSLGNYRLSKLTAAHVDAFIASKRSNYSKNSQRIMRSTLRKALNDAIKAGHLIRNVVDTSEPVKVSRRAQSFLTVDEAQRLLAAASGNRLAALYVVVLSLGLRKGEALALRWEDLDLDAGTVIIRRSLKRLRNRPLADGSYPDGRKTRLVSGSPKTENSWRTLNLPERVVAALRGHRRRQAAERLAADAWADDGLVFTTPVGSPIDPANFGKYLSAVAERAGLGHCNPHRLRHSAATILLAAGVPLHEVADVLGDTQEVAKTVYGHLTSERRRAAAVAMGDALWGQPAS